MLFISKRTYLYTFLLKKKKEMNENQCSTDHNPIQYFVVIDFFCRNMAKIVYNEKIGVHCLNVPP